ncbi:MAG: hypothetical protein PHQ43_10210 [Dehalococcoidales bacterium]|jgi:hypothetical protein|nr:hypothetical protein [Dehalococcoidales bacterium]
MAKRTDANQAEIMAALRKVGASVQSLHEVGRGCPDLVVGYHGHNYLMEVKMPFQILNAAEEAWHVKWKGQVAVVYGVKEALVQIGAVL